MVLEQLKKEYSPCELILLRRVHFQELGYNNLRQIFKRLVDEGHIRRYENGVYFLPDSNRLPDFGQVIKQLYISDGREVFGYEGAGSLAFGIGLANRQPGIPVIVTNKETSRGRYRRLKENTVYIKKPYYTVNADRAKVMQVLDLINEWEKHTDMTEDATFRRIGEYIRKQGFTKKILTECISYYPAKVSEQMMKHEMYEFFQNQEDE